MNELLINLGICAIRSFRLQFERLCESHLKTVILRYLNKDTPDG